MWENNDREAATSPANAKCGTHHHDGSGFLPHLQFNLLESHDTPLQLQRMQDELLEALNCVLEIAYSQGLVVPVSDKDGARPVEVSGVVSLEVRDVGAVVRDDGIEACGIAIVSCGALPGCAE